MRLLDDCFRSGLGATEIAKRLKVGRASVYPRRGGVLRSRDRLRTPPRLSRCPKEQDNLVRLVSLWEIGR